MKLVTTGHEDTGQMTGASSADDLPAGTELLHGQYKIDHYLNSGGFGITYLASDSLNRKVVIKECFPAMFARRQNVLVQARVQKHKEDLRQIVRHFIQEAQRLASMDHPNIVGVHQVFEDNDTAYMALDFIEGPDLLDAIEDTDTRLDEADVMSILRQILDAVAYMHKQGMLHRDISPDNILIGPDKIPVLIDFGAAREQARKTNRVLSALRAVKDGYSPQEFYVTDGVQGPFSDLYALAASFYHVITGERAPDSQTRVSAIAERKPDPCKLLQGRFDKYDDVFLEALDKAMSAMPKDRFQTADEWLEAIDHLAEPPAVEQDVKVAVSSSGGNKRVAIGGGLLALGVVGAVVGVLASGVFSSAPEPQITQEDILAAEAEARAQAEVEAAAAAEAIADATARAAEAEARLAQAEARAQAETTARAQAEAAAQAAAQAEAEARAKAATEAEARAQAEAEAAAQAAAQAEAEARAKAAVEAQARAQAEVEAASKAAAEAQARAQAEVEAASKAAAEAQARAQAEVEAAAQAAAEAEAEARLQAELEAAAKVEAENIAQANVEAEVDATTQPIQDLEPTSIESEWKVLLPFVASAENPDTVEYVTAEAPAWVYAGLRIDAVNGTKINDLNSISDILLQSGATPSQEGTLGVTLGLSNPRDGVEVREVILGVVQDTILSNGVMFQSQYAENGKWVTSVVNVPDDVGPGTTLKPDDQLTAYFPTDESIDGQDTIVDLLRAGSRDGQTDFKFTVRRGASLWLADLHYEGTN
ncbi:serine/threonine-protein kinase [uncultured Ruegeria sp.]|uniref:serine/threonine-protein kinase n=1 Tax=uncultured Ruegeria sp. TaxID=259304 RepID=UPI00260F718F|nr:serine/threonine-protein kinase [uncultured Ruegeria sp.]